MNVEREQWERPERSERCSLAEPLRRAAQQSERNQNDTTDPNCHAQVDPVFPSGPHTTSSDVPPVSHSADNANQQHEESHIVSISSHISG